MAKLYHKNATAISFQGSIIEPDEDGAFDVPEEAGSELMHPTHGFSAEPIEADQPKRRGRKSKTDDDGNNNEEDPKE
jgi:hypothetical protein